MKSISHLTYRLENKIHNRERELKKRDRNRNLQHKIQKTFTHLNNCTCPRVNPFPSRDRNTASYPWTGSCLRCWMCVQFLSRCRVRARREQPRHLAKDRLFLLGRSRTVDDPCKVRNRMRNLCHQDHMNKKEYHIIINSIEKYDYHYIGLSDLVWGVSFW